MSIEKCMDLDLSKQWDLMQTIYINELKARAKAQTRNHTLNVAEEEIRCEFDVN